MLELAIKRIWPVKGTTTGVLEADGRQVCFTLEDEVRQIDGLDVAEWKIAKETAIPRGRYRVVIDYSQRFQKLTPHLLDVPGFTGIRIHGGNRASDTEGCIIVGERRISDEMVAECLPALEEVRELIDSATANQEETWITIT